MNKLLRFLPVPRDLRHASCESEVSMKFSLTIPGKHALLALVAVCGVLPVANASCNYYQVQGEDNRPRTITISVPETVTLPANAVDGTVIYSSPMASPPGGASFYCTNDGTGIMNNIGPQPASGTTLFAIQGTGLSFRWKYNASTYAWPYGDVILKTGTGFWGTTHGFELVKTGPIKTSSQVPGRTVATWKAGALTPITLALSNAIKVIVKNPTCSLSATDIAVPLGTIKASSFSGVGSTSPSQPFKIGLSCEGGAPDATTTVSATLTDQTAPGNRSDQLSLTPASTATGVAIQVLRDSTVLKYGPDSNAPDNVNQWQAGTTGNGTFDIALTARYVQTTSKVTAGSANARTTITMSYR